MNNEDFCSYEIAQALKKAGFHWECNYYYHGCEICEGCGRNDYNDIRGYPNWVSAPSLAKAQKWLRAVKHWHVEVRINGCRNMFSVELWEMKPNGYRKRLEQSDGHVRLFDRYEDALSEGISETLKLIEEGEV